MKIRCIEAESLNQIPDKEGSLGVLIRFYWLWILALCRGFLSRLFLVSFDIKRKLMAWLSRWQNYN